MNLLSVQIGAPVGGPVGFLENMVKGVYDEMFNSIDSCWNNYYHHNQLRRYSTADLKGGFMGIQWRTDLSASPDFVKIDEQNGIQNHIRPSVNHTVGDVKINPVIYSSFANEFFAVYFQKDILIFSQLRTYFNQKYVSSITRTRLNPRRTTDTGPITIQRSK